MHGASLSSGAPALLLLYCCFTAALLRLGSTQAAVLWRLLEERSVVVLVRQREERWVPVERRCKLPLYRLALCVSMRWLTCSLPTAQV